MVVQDTEKSIQVMEAYTAGKQIQVRSRKSPPTENEWEDVEGRYGHTPAWNWQDFDYRVKPAEKPKPKEYWVLEGHAYENEGIANFAFNAQMAFHKGLGQRVVHVKEVIPS